MIVVKNLNFGGTERYAINLAGALIKKDISVFLVAGMGPYALHLPKEIKIFFAPILRSGRNNQISTKIIYRLAKKYKPQIIHAQCRNSLLCCQLARKTLNIPVISHEHLSYKNSEYAFVSDELNHNCDKIITITPRIKKKLVLNGLEQSKVVVILNGINLNDYPPINKIERIEARKSLNLFSDDKVILCLSRIVPSKKIDSLIDAFKIVHKKIADARLIITGDDEWGGTKIKIEDQIRKSGLSEKISLYPGQFNIRKFHAAADVFCHPSINRGFAVMEAMASELPIVAKRSLIKPLVAEHKIHGLLTQTNKAQELANQLITLLRNKILAKQMGKAARQKIEKKFNQDIMIKKTLKVYEQMIQSHTEPDKESFAFLYGD